MITERPSKPFDYFHQKLVEIKTEMETSKVRMTKCTDLITLLSIHTDRYWLNNISYRSTVLTAANKNSTKMIMTLKKITIKYTSLCNVYNTIFVCTLLIVEQVILLYNSYECDHNDEIVLPNSSYPLNTGLTTAM